MKKLKFEKQTFLTSLEIEIKVKTVNELKNKIKAFELLYGEEPLLYCDMSPVNFSTVVNDGRGTQFTPVSSLKALAIPQVLSCETLTLGRKYLILQSGFTLRIDCETTFILHY